MTLQVVDGSQLNLCSVNSRRETETVTKRLIVESEPVKPEIPHEFPRESVLLAVCLDKLRADFCEIVRPRRMGVGNSINFWK